MVTDGGRFSRGLITLHEIKQVPREAWNRTPLEAVMLREEGLTSVPPDAAIENVLQIMSAENINQVPVVQNGQLLGVVGRDRLLALVQTRLEFKA